MRTELSIRSTIGRGGRAEQEDTCTATSGSLDSCTDPEGEHFWGRRTRESKPLARQKGRSYFNATGEAAAEPLWWDGLLGLQISDVDAGNVERRAGTLGREGQWVDLIGTTGKLASSGISAVPARQPATPSQPAGTLRGGVDASHVLAVGMRDGEPIASIVDLLTIPL